MNFWKITWEASQTEQMSAIFFSNWDTIVYRYNKPIEKNRAHEASNGITRKNNNTIEYINDYENKK